MIKRISALFAIPEGHPQGLLFMGIVLTGMVGILAGIGAEMFWLAGIPAAIMVAWLAIVDFRRLFFLMLACIPISVELEFGGLGTDLPDEPMMWLLTLTSIAWFLRNGHKVEAKVIRHPITLALLAHLMWMVICAVTSQDTGVSLKFLAAKSWYVIVFYFLGIHILQEQRDFREFLWYFFVSLLITVVIVFTRHALIGFSFEQVAYVMGPFYRNHVSYACIMTVFLPFVWYGAKWYPKGSLTRIFLLASVLFLIIAINFAYTRAAYVALVAAIGIYWIIRRHWLRGILAGVLALFVVFFVFVGSRDNWLEFAPDYERTVTHTRFDNLLEATTKLEDISTMERVYRWIAATYMIREKPVTGFGPGTFYFYYRNYTVTSFKTYVSGNPEKSGIHNYYLMTTVEQGIPGLIFFLTFCFIVMLKGEQIYHRTPNRQRRQMLVAALLCFILIDLLMLMNDLVETDKVGSLFFLSAAILVAIDLKNKSEKAEIS
jgi:O-antigen ligase